MFLKANFIKMGSVYYKILVSLLLLSSTINTFGSEGIIVPQSKPDYTFSVPGWMGIAFNKGKNEFILLNSQGKTIINMNDGTVKLFETYYDSSYCSVAISNDGSKYARYNFNKNYEETNPHLYTCQIVDLETDSILYEYQKDYSNLDYKCPYFLFSHDSRKFVDQGRVVNLTNNSVLALPSAPLLFSNTDKYVYQFPNRIYDSTNGNEICILQESADPPRSDGNGGYSSVGFSYDDNYFITIKCDSNSNEFYANWCEIKENGGVNRISRKLIGSSLSWDFYGFYSAYSPGYSSHSSIIEFVENNLAYIKFSPALFDSNLMPLYYFVGSYVHVFDEYVVVIQNYEMKIWRKDHLLATNPTPTATPTISPTSTCTPTLTETLTPTPTPTTCVSDSDQDGISDCVENNGPNGGDANQDGIPDRNQAGVATLQSAGSISCFLTLSVPDGVRIESMTSQSQLPSGSEWPTAEGLNAFPFGLLNYKIASLSEGATVETTLIINGDLGDLKIDDFTYYKFGSTPEQTSDHWYSYSYDGLTGAQIPESGQTIHLYFKDGVRGDDDLTSNGVIPDPGGPSTLQPAGISSWGEF